MLILSGKSAENHAGADSLEFQMVNLLKFQCNFSSISELFKLKFRHFSLFIQCVISLKFITSGLISACSIDEEFIICTCFFCDGTQHVTITNAADIAFFFYLFTLFSSLFSLMQYPSSFPFKLLLAYMATPHVLPSSHLTVLSHHCHLAPSILRLLCHF